MSSQRHTSLLHQFNDLEQQRLSYEVGMWIFLATEFLLFGTMFAGYMVYRTHFPAAWAAGSQELNVLLGLINTAILLISSMFIALAVRAGQLGLGRSAAKFLLVTMALGSMFLAIKAYEYHDKWSHHLVPGLNFEAHPEHPFGLPLFLSFYFTMTGVHAFHMIIGLGIVGLMAFWCWRGRFTAEHNSPLVMTGLYWHFVDIVWIYLYPLFYLIGR